MSSIAVKLDKATIVTQGIAVILGSWLIAAGAYIEVPMWPVPMTMQSLAVLLIGGAYGLRLASITTAAYLAQGSLGLPVFAGGAGGPVHLIGPTGGYLVGFIVCACIIAFLYERGFHKGWVRPALAMTLGSVALMACGVLWLSQYVGMENAIATGLAPFTGGMVVKAALALLILKGTDRFIR